MVGSNTCDSDENEEDLGRSMPNFWLMVISTSVALVVDVYGLVDIDC